MNIVQLAASDIKPIRELIADEQGGLCPICNKKLNRPCLDHDHIKRLKGTGQIRGVLCSTCNTFLAKIENNCIRHRVSRQKLPEVLRNIAEYLLKDQHPYIHPSEKGNIK